MQGGLYRNAVTEARAEEPKSEERDPAHDALFVTADQDIDEVSSVSSPPFYSSLVFLGLD